jgi:predicted O-linked N-acetylglucosamine transferase (SPINDLY family)
MSPALRNYAESNGISGSRFIFAEVYPLESHVYYKGVCDVHLDNVPYSAHGTLADVMYTGVPHIAMPMDTMASRVSSSLLLAGGYPSHLIAYDLVEYQSILMTMLHPELRSNMKLLKAKLRAGVLQSAAFDSSLFARELERGLKVFWESAHFSEQHMNVKVAAVQGEI